MPVKNTMSKIILGIVTLLILGVGIYFLLGGGEIDQSPSTDTPAYETYTNDQFNFSFDYPTNVFPSVNRAQNDAGVILSSFSGETEIRAFGISNDTDASLTDIFTVAREDFSSIETQEGHPTYALFKGIDQEGDVLIKRIDLRDNVIINFELSYPQEKLSKDAVDRILSSLRMYAGETETGFLVTIALLDYSGESDGKERGCDKVVFVERNVPQTEAPLNAALDELFSFTDTTVEGWNNFIAKTRDTLSFQRATIENGVASIYLTGELSGLAGVCDNPRAKIQIEETALQFPTVDKVNIYLNGKITDLQPDGRG